MIVKKLKVIDGELNHVEKVFATYEDVIRLDFYKFDNGGNTSDFDGTVSIDVSVYGLDSSSISQEYATTTGNVRQVELDTSELNRAGLYEYQLSVTESSKKYVLARGIIRLESLIE
jgi:hypothetical protein